ncbi:MAG: hypothetical protein WKF77_32275 [Planctomycetaceae bacterium]
MTFEVEVTNSDNVDLILKSQELRFVRVVRHPRNAGAAYGLSSIVRPRGVLRYAPQTAELSPQDTKYTLDWMNATFKDPPSELQVLVKPGATFSWNVTLSDWAANEYELMVQYLKFDNPSSRDGPYQYVYSNPISLDVLTDEPRQDDVVEIHVRQRDKTELKPEQTVPLEIVFHNRSPQELKFPFYKGTTDDLDLSDMLFCYGNDGRVLPLITKVAGPMEICIPVNESFTLPVDAPEGTVVARAVFYNDKFSPKLKGGDDAPDRFVHGWHWSEHWQHPSVRAQFNSLPEPAAQHNSLPQTDAQQNSAEKTEKSPNQLMSLYRQDGYQKLMSSVLLRDGELQDFRFLQQCLRMKTPTQFTADIRTRICSDLTLEVLKQWYVAPQEVPQLNPLATIIFVDLLDRDRLVGLPGRQKHISILEFDQSQNSLVILQRLTGHEVEWDRNAPLSERKAAMDQWLAWWHESGRADYLQKHPEVAPLFEDAWQKRAPVAIDELPDLVDAEDPREFCRISYRVPRDSVARLVAEDSLLGNTVPQFADRFRFATPAAAEKWFRSESSVSGQLLPCMIVPVADSMDADSKGRIWCRWDLFGFPPAVFENGEWTTFPDQRLPNSWTSVTSPGNSEQGTSLEIIEPPRSGNEGSMFFPSLLITNDKSELRFDLIDSQGWLRFSEADLPQHPSFDRILQAAPVGTSKYIARDRVGRILVSYGVWSVIENGKEIPRSAQLRSRRDSDYTPQAVIGNGYVWLFRRHDFEPSPFGIDQFVALAVEQGEIVEKPLPLAPQVGPPSVWINQGPFASIDPTRNRDRFVTVFDSNGNVVARHDGHLVGVDSHGGHWLALGPEGAVESIQRMNPAGKTQIWKNAKFRGRDKWSETLFDLAFAPDGTVWLPIGEELVHMRGDDDLIEVIERFPLPEPGWQRIECDPSVDVWIVFQNHKESDKRPRLYRFATHRRAADNKPR